MRITTQMLSETAKKSGLPINRPTLLDYIESDGMNNSLLDALNKSKKVNTDMESKTKYEKLDKQVDQLTQSAEALLKDGEDNLFEQAKAAGSNDKVYEAIEKLFENYNNTLKELRSTSDTMNEFYRQMLMDSSTETKESMKDMGVLFVKDGYAAVDMEKIKAADFTALEGLFGKDGDFVNKLQFISTRISDNAEANIESLSSAYNSSGYMNNLTGINKFDFWG